MAGQNIGREAERLAVEGMQEALRGLAEEILQKAQENVPVGDPAHDPNPNASLRESGHVVPDGHGGFLIVFDGPYAAFQHEGVHLRHPRGGKAKYLEDALKDAIPELETAVAFRVKANLSRLHGRRR